MSTIIERPHADADDADPRVARIRLDGDLDARSVQDLRNELDAVLRDGGVATVIIDLGLVRFVDSSGLGALIEARTHADVTGTRLLLNNPANQLRRLMAITGAEDMFDWA